MLERNNGELSALVVDNTQSSRNIVKAILTSMGFSNIVEAANGMEALQKFSDGNFDLVISDWDMPQLGGLDVLKFIRKTRACDDTPFIMLTNKTKAIFVKQAIQNGVSAYVIKPIKAGVLATNIENVLKKEDARAA